MVNSLIVLGFLSIFHVIGAATLAHGLRGVWSGLRDEKRRAIEGLFFVVWGAPFGCIPFIFGLELATNEGWTSLVLVGEALIWGSTFLVALLAWDKLLDWLRPFLHHNMFLIAFGGIFMMIGAGVAALVVRDDLLFGLLFGGIFTLAGGIIFVIGIWMLLRETP